MDVPCSYPLVTWPTVHRKQLAMPDMAAIRSPTANSGPSKKALRCRLMTKTMLSVRQERRQATRLPGNRRFALGYRRFPISYREVLPLAPRVWTFFKKCSDKEAAASSRKPCRGVTR